MATPDWEAIETAYRAGMMSLREIAAQHGISEGAIRNHFIAYVRNSQYIKTRIAAPVGTFMIPRQNPFDNYNTLVWSAVGLQIKRDFNGRSKVFNAQG